MEQRRVLLLGATGFTGQKVLTGLLTRGVRPTLAGRSVARLEALCESMDTTLPIVEVDATADSAITTMIDDEDVVMSTVGPFMRLGRVIASAVARAGARYLDSTGEPPFIRWAFEGLDPIAQSSGAVMVPAFGYDYVPGNLAGALAAHRAGTEARHIDVGYFLLPGSRELDRRASLNDCIRLTTGATRASLIGVIAEPSFVYRNAADNAWGLEQEMSARRLQRFSFRGLNRLALTVGGSEHFGLPQSFPDLDSVDVCLGWFGGWSRPVHLLSRACAPILRTRRIRDALTTLAGRLPGRDHVPTRPGTSLVIAIARDSAHRPISSVTLAGPDPYALTGQLLAFGAKHAVTQPMPAGVQGPVAAFGLDSLSALARGAGLIEITDDAYLASK